MKFYGLLRHGKNKRYYWIRQSYQPGERPITRMICPPRGFESDEACVLDYTSLFGFDEHIFDEHGTLIRWAQH